MQLKRLLLTTTSLCMLSLLPLTALGQDAGLTAAYNAYVEAQSGDDADAKAAAEAAFLAECQRNAGRGGGFRAGGGYWPTAAPRPR